MEKNKAMLAGNRAYQLFLAVIAPLTVLLIWALGSNLGLIRASILPSPQRVLSTLISLCTSGQMAEDLSISMLRVLRGFGLGAVCGIIIGSLMGFSKTANKVLGSLVSILRPVPMLAWVPLFILWLGIGESSKTAVIFIGSFWSVLLNTIHGIQSTGTKLLEVAYILKKSKWETITSVYLPSALPSVFTGLRLGMGSAWTCVVGAEMIAASSGIGYMISYARELAQPAKVFAGIIVIGAIGLLIDQVLLTAAAGTAEMVLCGREVRRTDMSDERNTGSGGRRPQNLPDFRQ